MSQLRFALVTRCLPGLLAVLLAAAACTAEPGAPDGWFHWSIATAVEIDAPPDRVWNVLVDLPAYPAWNPFIVRASGRVAVGETLVLHMALPDREPMVIEPRLLVVEPERELRWKGRLLLPGLFDGEHGFTLVPLDGGRTRVEHWEEFGGVLLPIARGLVHNATVEAFHALNAALAERARGAEPAIVGR
jgi:hypothetical protein